MRMKLVGFQYVDYFCDTTRLRFYTLGFADTVLDEINNYLDFDYLAELQAHVDDDDDENKADTVAVAQRVKQWQSSKSARLAEACAHAAGFTGTFNTQSVELWFQQQLAGV